MAASNQARRGFLLVSPSPLLLVSILLYAIVMVTVIWSLSAARHWALTELANAKSVSDWQTWREDVKREQSHPGPVRRRVPQSAEPPALVLMRDYFAVCLAGAIVFMSVLYWVTAWFISGILKPNVGGVSDADPRAPAANKFRCNLSRQPMSPRDQ